MALTAEQHTERRARIGGYRHPIVVTDDLRERFEEKFTPEPNTGCWLWLGSTNAGYGHMRQGRRMLKAHRVSYTIFVGPIPDDREPDHRCRVHPCVNPEHLELVTHQENVIRGVSLDFNLSKTHCPKGHAYNASNTYAWTNGAGSTQRQCRACMRERKMERARAAGVGPKRKSHCQKGHPLPDVSGKRECPICKSARRHAYHERTGK